GRYDHTRRVVFISKMVGRDAEAKAILDDYAEVVSGGFRSAFISGLPGIGKTRLIQELQRPLVANRGYFTSGKFDQYQKNIPYSSLLQALSNLLRTFLTESDERVQAWRERILAAVGSLGQVVTEVIPELATLIGPQPEIGPLPPVEARNRFNRVFGCFLASLASEDNPLILFIDDLQWCDSATFDFLQHVFNNTEDYRHLYFIGAFRHNEVGPEHPLSDLLRNILPRRPAPREIQLGPLAGGACHKMVAYILDLPLEETHALATFLADLTEGNPLFVSESLSWLHNEQLLIQGTDNQWSWNLEQIRGSAMPASVVELFGAKVRRLDPEVLEMLKVCACMGNRFAAEDIARVHDVGIQALFESLKPVLSFGLLMETKAELQFVHDRVQEAVLRLIDADHRRAIHWRVGHYLLGDTEPGPALEQLEQLFTIAAHLNLGRPQPLTTEEALKLAVINYYAGEKALNALAAQAANEYFRTGLELLPDDAWERQYSLCYRLHQKLAKTELMRGRYEQSEVLLDDLLSHAADDLDRAEALAEQTASLSSIGNFIKAIETANRGLDYFGRSIPMEAAAATDRMKTLMDEIHGQHGDIWGTILHMPFTTDRRSKIELSFYSELIPDLYMSGLPPQLYLSAAQSTLHCLEGGMDESVIYSFSIMGLNLGEQGQFELAFRYQDLAHELCARYPDTFGATRGMNGIVWCNMHSRSHPREIAGYCRKGIQCGRNCGDLYNAGLSYGPLMWNLQVEGNSLTAVEEAAAECLAFSRKNQLEFSVGLAEAMYAGWIEPMKNPAAIPQDMTDKLVLWESRNHVASTGSYFVHLGISHFYFGRYREAETCLQAVQTYLSGLTDNVLKRQWYAFRILSPLRRQRLEGGDKAAMRAEVEPLLDQLQTWAQLGPLLQPYLALCRAEWASCFDGFAEASAAWLDAIEAAHRNGYVLLEGYANESFGDWLAEQQRGNPETFRREALRLYRGCGAVGKEIQLVERFPGLRLEPHGAGDTEPAPTAEELVLPNLDTDYLIKSALALSAEMDQARLLAKIMAVVLQSSGAQHGYLLRSEDGIWQIGAESHYGEPERWQARGLRLQEAGDICQGIVHYVIRTRALVVLADAQQSQQFRNLPEIAALSLRSVLCLPLLRQAELVGVLYLENRLAAGVFTEDRVRMTDLLSLQAAISLENARLLAEIAGINADLERRIEEAAAKSRLKDHLLIQQSRLAVMGEMINNIAHQWRQPLNALGLVLGNLKDAQEYGELTPEYLLNQVAEGRRFIVRMSQTIDNFRDFFSPNKPREWFSLNQAVDDACGLVRAGLNAHGIGLEVETEGDIRLYGVCGEYSQVLLNLLTNAKEAIQQSGRPHGRIRIRVDQDQIWARVRVADNGGGIGFEALPHVFDPYFSTKEGGTGIGLYMSRMIVENSLHGRIEARNAEDGAEFTIFTPLPDSGPGITEHSP
ncbi:MAG: GAF domain-containing protein, partial [Methylococcaceae bacterium]|nr:GAF domain-containing protein [Methylococcaceae bacterium]